MTRIQLIAMITLGAGWPLLAHGAAFVIRAANG